MRSWDATNKQVVTIPETKICTLIEGTDEEGWMTLTNGYYLVIGEQIFKALTISGDVHLILADGCKLKCNHIKLEQGNSLYIYSESDGDNKGQLYAENEKAAGYYSEGAAGIGGGDQKNSGSLYVHGGYVKATANDLGFNIGGAGIGGGDNYVIGGEVVIYGGNVSATGHSGAGIGGGSGGSQGGPVTIYGGDVSAESTAGGAGIGGGYQQNGGSVYIYGGNVSATGANFERYGGGPLKTRYSAGIGGGVDNYVGDLHIYGGTVKPTGGKQSQCVAASVEIANGMKVTTKAGPVAAADRAQTCYITGRSNELTIFPCPHDGGFNYIFIGDTKHNRICNYCGLEEEEAHTYDGDNPCVCGKPHNTTADLWSVTMYRATGAASTSYAYHEVMKVVKGQPFTVPAVGATEGLTLMGYTTSWTEGDGIEMKDGETLTTVGAVVTPNADMSYYPRYRYRYVPTWTWNETDATATLTITCSKLSNEVISVTNITYTVDEEEGVKTATATYVHNGATYTFTSTSTLPVESLTLLDADSNEDVLDICRGLKVPTVTLSGRTFYKDGSWNTLCLPFNVSGEQLKDKDNPLYDATIMTLGNSPACETGFDAETGTLNLEFIPNTDGNIQAGVAYIVKWDSGDAIVNPTFTNVTIANETTDDHATESLDKKVSFVGTYNAISYTEDTPSVLYLGDDNTLYYPSGGFTIGAFRAVFQLKDITAGDPVSAASVRRFVLNFGDGEATGIQTIPEESGSEGAATGWYTLDGRRLSGKPTQSGVYVYNGRKVVIK